MNRPRKPFGKEQPGRLPSTMMKVLAAELADPERLRRGKRLAKDGSVLDIVIEPGTVVCEVQGSRPTPYVVTVEVSFGNGMPLKRDVDGHCTCPDADNLWGTGAGGSDICKHTVATMYTLADELLVEPELLDLLTARVRLDERWRDDRDHRFRVGEAFHQLALDFRRNRGFGQTGDPNLFTGKLLHADFEILM